MEKELTLPDNSNYFLVTGPDTKKYLIRAERYSHYGITAGKIIKCKIDKVNCRGKVFLEPENPWYSEGKSYSFLVMGTEVRTDNSGNKHKSVVVTDKTGNKIIVPQEAFSSIPAKATKVNLKVERISKAKLYLTASSGEISDSSS